MFANSIVCDYFFPAGIDNDGRPCALYPGTFSEVGHRDREVYDDGTFQESTLIRVGGQYLSIREQGRTNPHVREVFNPERVSIHTVPVRHLPFVLSLHGLTKTLETHEDEEIVDLARALSVTGEVRAGDFHGATIPARRPETAAVVLDGDDKPPIVAGVRCTRPLTPLALLAVRAMLSAPAGLTCAELNDLATGHRVVDALRELKKTRWPDYLLWRAVLHAPPPGMTFISTNTERRWRIAAAGTGCASSNPATPAIIPQAPREEAA
jgi:hypothetical protein